MASAKLTTTVRDQIVARLLRHRFSGEAAQLIADRAAFAERVYDAVFAKAQRDRMNALPKGWLPTTSQVTISFGGTGRDSYASLYLSGRDYGVLDSMLDTKPDTIERPVPSIQQQGCLKAFEPTDALSVEHESLCDRAASLKSAIAEARSSIGAVVNSVTTTGKLREAWPEIGTFLDDFEEVKLSLPAVPTRELNALLDLPVDGQP